MERRHHRSEKAGEAAGLYLRAVKERTGVEAVALANEDGLLVAGAGALDLDWLAAVGASAMCPRVEWQGRTVHVRRMRVRSEQVYLASIGARPSDEVTRGLSRIFAA